MKRLLRLVSPSLRSFAVLAFAILAATAPPASAEGTRTLHPNGAVGERGVMDSSDGTFFANVARGRQFLYVYAQAGEHILLGSRNRSNGGGIFVYNPQSFGTPGDETIPGAANFTCSTGGTIASRAQELAGPNSADGTATVTDGFTPCSYIAPTTGIYGVRFTGASSGGQTNSASIATPPILAGDLVSAWDVTVRGSANSLADLNGRLFTYAWTVYLNSNSRRLYNDLYYVSTDGYRYKQTFQGLDPNRAAFYANAAGFLDTNGAPLYRDLRGGNAAVTNGPSITAGITAQRPQYPIFFSDIAPAGTNATEVARVLTALAIPLVPAQPQLSSPIFVGNVGGNTSTQSSGGVFTFTTLNTLTYEIVISRDGSDFDPANVLNRVLTGTALTGNHTVLWNGRDNNGNPFPVGNYDFRIVGRNGEIHFPMIDVEANFDGGPTLTKLNGSALDTTTVYYDDRGYVAANTTAIGTLNGHLCGAGSAVTTPVPTHSLVGVDSSNANLGGSGNYYRSWNGSVDSNNDCQNAATQYFGTAKGLDLWALERSPVYEEDIVIVAPSVGVDVGTLVSVTPAVLSGQTAFGTFVFSNAGDTAATGVTYGVTLGNPAVTATCPAAVSFSLLPPGVVATYNPAPACTITFTGMPTTLTPGQALSFNFSYVVAPTNPGPIPIATVIAATNENNNVAPNNANAQTVVARPVITVAKSANPASGAFVDIGDLIAYTVSVTIANAPLSTTFTLADTLDPGLTFGSVISNSPAFNCSGSLTCTLPTGTATGTYTVTYSATVANTAVGSVSNSVQPSGGGGDTPPACSPTCTTTHPLNEPNLVVGKTGPATAVVGVAYNYTLTVTNNGSADATANATVTDVVPNGLTINSAGPGCTFVGQTMTCTIAQADLQMTESVVITINVTPTAAAGASVSNTASTTGGGDPDCVAAGDCDSPPVVTTLNAPNLVIAKTGPATAVVGVAYNYTLTVTNSGTADATANATVTDVVPAGLTINSAGPGCTFVGQTVTCTIAQADLQMTESVVITINVTPTAAAGASVSNTASVIGGGDPDCVAAGNCGSPPVNTTLNAPNLVIAKTGPATAVVGVAYDYTLTVTNNGTADATANATVTDVVPAGLTINSAGPGCTFVGQTVTCTIAQADLQTSESVVITINVTPTAAAGASVSNTASVIGGGDPDCVAAGNCGSPPVNTTLNAPNLVIAKTGPATAVVGVAYDYTLTVTNNGTADATANATVTDVVPTGLTINSAGPGCTIVGQTVTCTIAQADLQTSESVVITINVTPTAAAGASVSNTASITGGGDPDCVAAGDCDSPPVDTTLNAPNLVIAKTGPAAAVVGVAYDYTLTVTNNGTADATANATVTDVVPAGLTINSAGPGCTFVGQAVTCTIAQADLQTSESVVITINVTPTAAAGASVSNTASITGGGDPDCEAASDCDSPPVDTTLNAPNLTIAKTGPATAVVGVVYDYTLTVTNSGTADATANATVTDVVPAGLTINSAGPGCTFVGQTVTCTIAQADLQMAESVAITINVTPTAAAGASVSNTASVIGGGDPDCEAAGDCDSPPVDTTLNAPNLTIAKTGPATAVVSVAYDYTLTVTNSGTADATADATVTDVVPTGLTINSAGPGCTFAGQTVTCTIAQADLQMAESVAITINVTPTAAAGASVSNTASVIGGGDPDCEAAGDCDSPPVDTTITEPDVSVSKTANPADGTAVAAGDTITYTLGVVVTGAATTQDLVLTDTLDPQLENVQIVNNADGFVLGGAGNTRTFTLPEDTAIGTYSVSYSADVVASATGSVGNNVVIDPAGNGGDPDPECTDCSTTHPLVSDVTLVKTLSAEGNLPADGIASPGETLTYAITLSNSGGVDETGYAVTDLLDANMLFVSADNGGSHAAGTVTWTGLTVPATDSLVLTVVVSVVDPLPADAVQVVNLAFPTGGVTPSCPSAGCVQTPVPVVPDLSLVKQATLNDGNGNALADAGESIDYTLTATNTGNIILTDVEIDDTRLPSLTCTPTQPATLDIGDTLVCTGSYTVTQGDVDAGAAIVNAATATAPDPTDPDPTNPTLPPLEDDDSTSTPIAPSVPGIDLLKEITSGATYANAGDSIVYRLTATNTGNVTLTSVGIVDPLLGMLVCTPTQPATLAPGATLVCTGSYSVTPGDIDNGSVTNTATVTATPPSGGSIQDSDEEVATGPLAGPSIVVLKTRTDATAPVVAGTLLSYQIVATNNGNVTLSGVTVSDSLIAGLTCVPTLPATLAAGASVTCTGSYTTTQGDVDAGSVTNTATASGTPPGPVGTPPVTDTDDEITTIPPTPALEVIKVATLNDSNGNGTGDEGESIAYAVSVRNTGNVTLIDLVVTDSLGGAAPVTLTCAPTTLAPNQTATCTGYSHTITLAEAIAGAALVNVATATANDPDGDPVTGSDNTSTPLGDVIADLAIQKTGPATGEIGAEVTFTIVVRNLGPNTAVNTVLTDPTPAGLQFVANTGACTTAFPCDLGNLALGESRTVQTRFLIPAGYSGPSTIVNIASVTSDTPDPTPGDTSSSASTVVGSGFTPSEPAVIPVNRHQALVLLVLLMLVMASGALRRRG